MRTFLWLIGGIALYALSRGLARLGDASALADGVSWDRLAYHGAALFVLLGGLVCFLRAGILAYRTIRGGPVPSSTSKGAADGTGPDEEPEFDPDAALARYLASKGEGTAAEPEINRPKPAPGGFGRRGL